MSKVTADLIAENTFTSWISLTSESPSNHDSQGFLDLLIEGTWVGIITVQKRHFHGPEPITYTNPFDLEDYTDNTVKLIEDHSTTTQYRIGFKTGNYTSGTASVRLEQ